MIHRKKGKKKEVINGDEIVIESWEGKGRPIPDSNVQSTSTNKHIQDNKGYRGLYTNRGVITYDEGNADYFRKLDTGKNFISLYALGDGTVSYTKNGKDVIKKGKAGERLARRKDKKMDIIEKRFK